jgi:hypothetical protein
MHTHFFLTFRLHTLLLLVVFFDAAFEASSLSENTSDADVAADAAAYARLQARALFWAVSEISITCCRFFFFYSFVKFVISPLSRHVKIKDRNDLNCFCCCRRHMATVILESLISLLLSSLHCHCHTIVTKRQ